MTHGMILLTGAIERALKDSGRIGVYAGARVFEYQTTGYTLDCVEYRITAGGVTNQSPRRALDVTVEVYGVSIKRERAQAIADAIQDAMTAVRMIGWDVYYVQEGSWIARKFYSEGQQYWAMGQQYEIRAAKRG